MKSTNIFNLRASVTNGVWSSSDGANKVLQTAWEKKKADQKLIFLFSTTHGYVVRAQSLGRTGSNGKYSYKHSGKYCGMAEMSGPFNPAVDPQIWTPGLKGNQGIIPLRWIVAKDVAFAVFEELKYKGKAVTQLRHANT